MSWRKFRIGEEVRRAWMLSWTLKCIKVLKVLREPGSHLSLLPEVREMAPLGRWGQFHKFLGNNGFYLTSRNPGVQVELDLDSILDGVWSLAFWGRNRVPFGPDSFVMRREEKWTVIWDRVE